MRQCEGCQRHYDGDADTCPFCQEAATGKEPKAKKGKAGVLLGGAAAMVAQACMAPTPVLPYGVPPSPTPTPTATASPIPPYGVPPIPTPAPVSDAGNEPGASPQP